MEHLLLCDYSTTSVVLTDKLLVNQHLLLEQMDRDFKKKLFKMYLAVF